MKAHNCDEDEFSISFKFSLNWLKTRKLIEISLRTRFCLLHSKICHKNLKLKIKKAPNDVEIVEINSRKGFDLCLFMLSANKSKHLTHFVHIMHILRAFHEGPFARFPTIVFCHYVFIVIFPRTIRGNWRSLSMAAEYSLFLWEVKNDMHIHKRIAPIYIFNAPFLIFTL